MTFHAEFGLLCDCFSLRIPSAYVLGYSTLLLRLHDELATTP